MHHEVHEKIEATTRAEVSVHHEDHEDHEEINFSATN
jgi:hypothetical protein